MDPGEKLIGWTVATVVVFLLSQFVLSPVLNLAAGSFESIGLTSLFTALTIILAVSDITGIKLPSFD